MPHLTLVAAILDRPFAWGETKCVLGEKGRVLTLCIVGGKLAVNILSEGLRPVVVSNRVG
jgi:hypothetical protein